MLARPSADSRDISTSAGSGGDGNSSYEVIAPRQPDDQLPGVSHPLLCPEGPSGRSADAPVSESRSMAFRGELTHCPPNTSGFIAELRLKASNWLWLTMRSSWLRTCPHRKPARRKVTLQDAVDLLALTASQPENTGSSSSHRKVTVGQRNPASSMPSSAGPPHHAEGSSSVSSSMSRQRLFAQRLPGSA